jgi:hypothetical protein
MTAILSTATLELVPAVSTLLYDPYASHLLRYALLLITGAPFPSADDDRLRSKKSRKFKSGQAPLRSITQTDGDEGKGKARERVVPDELVQAKGALLEALDEALGRSTDGAAARQAASEGVACIVVQVRRHPSRSRLCVSHLRTDAAQHRGRRRERRSAGIASRSTARGARHQAGYAAHASAHRKN